MRILLGHIAVLGLKLVLLWYATSSSLSVVDWSFTCIVNLQSQFAAMAISENERLGAKSCPEISRSPDWSRVKLRVSLHSTNGI